MDSDIIDVDDFTVADGETSAVAVVDDEQARKRGRRAGVPDRQCTAMSRQAGRRCNNPAMKGRSNCRFHGGKTLVGAANPAYKHGKYSKHLPERMRERFMEALDDPELLNHKSEIALTESRLVDLLERVDTGESGEIWKSLQRTWKTFVSTRDDDEKKTALREIGALITRGRNDWQTWEAVFDAVDTKRRLQDSEQRRRIAMNAMVSVDEAITMASALTEAIRQEVVDPLPEARVLLGRIHHRFSLITGFQMPDK